MPLDLALDLAHALDPVAFVQDRLNFEPDPWQARLLRSRAPWILLNCCRQSGKSTTTAALALHIAIYDPGLTLLVSPSLRQSKELFAKVTGFLKDLEPAEVLEEDNKSCCTLANGARLVSLPGDPDTLRGYSAPKLIIKDEAAYVSDAMQAALDPMLAASKVVIDLMAALKRSLAQETPATGGTTANEGPVRPAADRRQRSLLLPVAGGRRRREKTATEPAAVAVRPRKKA